MPILDRLPEAIRSALAAEPLLDARTDLLNDGRFGEQRLTITGSEITVWLRAAPGLPLLRQK